MVEMVSQRTLRNEIKATGVTLQRSVSSRDLGNDNGIFLAKSKEGNLLTPIVKNQYTRISITNSLPNKEKRRFVSWKEFKQSIRKKKAKSQKI